MPRRKPFSNKQRKVQLQEKRAIKRGDSPPLTAQKSRPELRPSARPQRSQITDPTSQKLQSRFVALTPAYLGTTRNLAHSTVLPRPIPAHNAVFPVELLERDHGGLTCPGRPKFKFGQTKKEVEKNEEGWFKKWLKATQGIVEDWVEGGGEEEDGWPRSTSWFETNLEVWRQLWRVTETSSILLLLLDSRCPPVHCPPSLRRHIQSLKGQKEVILVLTKSDLVDPQALEGWEEWVKDWWGSKHVGVVSVMSYDLSYLSETGKHRPEIPPSSLDALVQAIKEAHKRLLTPPERVQEDSEKLAKWRAPVRSQVDWRGLTCGGERAVDYTTVPSPSTETPVAKVEGRNAEHEPLTIGLIGQPNVGKSSLLNAILGQQRVRASKTPGKTKHFQTLFWGDKKEIKLVDCPGLVCPSLVGLEMQAMAGILPISQIPSLPACIHHVAQLLPLEEIYRIPPPEQHVDDFAGKKTWREPREETGPTEKPVQWTAGAIMEGRALERGYLTAKSGRPDANRAANGIMRNVADGRIRWGFWPPGADITGGEGKGIWLDQVGVPATIEDERSDDEDDSLNRNAMKDDVEDGGEGEETNDLEQVQTNDDHDGSSVEDAESEEDEASRNNVNNFFAALDGPSDSEEEGEEEDYTTTTDAEA